MTDKGLLRADATEDKKGHKRFGYLENSERGTGNGNGERGMGNGEWETGTVERGI